MEQDKYFQTVTLTSATGEIERAVYKETEVTVEVCREEELLSALSTGRIPVTIGFKKRDVISYGENISVCA